MKTVHMIGNAHIDPVWLWQWQEGYQEIKASFQSALDRMDESDDFIFTCACADYYRWVEENAPDMFEKIKARVAEGRWRIVGGMWIQPDANIPSGESFARQLLYSQRYFIDKFGVQVKTGYNVDTFGHNGMLPQLLKRAGIDNYVFMRPDSRENAQIPAPLFIWESMDGSQVNAFRILGPTADGFHDGYGSAFGEVDKKIANAFSVADEKGYPVMSFYGVGNHGGGPTIKNIASIHRYMKEEKRGGEVGFSSPDEYFDLIREKGYKLPVWNKELQHHASGCYSATSMIKMMNRKAELALYRSEVFAAMADKLTGHTAYKNAYRQAWNNVMFNQFHDIMCGCSIREAYDDARAMLGESIAIAAREENAALQKISWRVDTMAGRGDVKRSKESDFGLWELDGKGTPVVVFNPHPFEAVGEVRVKRKLARATDELGTPIPMQTIRASRTNNKDKWDCLFEARVPALGYRLYWIFLAGDEYAPESGLKITEHTIENNLIRAQFDPKTGAMISLVNKKTGKETLSGAAQTKLIDIEHCDTWAHGIFTFDKEAGTFEGSEFKVIEEGPVRATLRVTTRYKDSSIVQDYSLRAESDQIDVNVKLDLHEKFRLVKLCFPVNAADPKAHAEIAYGLIEREPNGEEETGQRWMQLGNEKGGLCLLNDSKYSFSAIGNELRLTVANSSIYADHYGQDFRDDLCVHLDMGEQEFRYAIVPHDGPAYAANFAPRAALFNQPLVPVVETYHKGDLPVMMDGIAIDQANVEVGAIKRAETENAYVLRLHETTGVRTKAHVDAKLFGRAFDMEFGPCEIKTVMLPDDAGKAVYETLLTEL